MRDCTGCSAHTHKHTHTCTYSTDTRRWKRTHTQSLEHSNCGQSHSLTKGSTELSWGGQGDLSASMGWGSDSARGEEVTRGLVLDVLLMGMDSGPAPWEA